MANIMIIDQKTPMDSMIYKGLHENGHTVKYCEDTSVVMDELRLNKTDIVLLDPYFRGFEKWDALHSIKKEYPDLPVVVFSAYKNFLSDPRLAEARGFVIKSVHINELISKIDEILA